MMKPQAESDPTEEPLFRFADAFEKELIEISERRKLVGFDEQATREGQNKTLRRTLVGLALSGGGIRSATFCLGLLQKMHEMGLLRTFDYLSTVSGGGYLGSWWSAWLARPQFGAADLRQPEEFVETLLTSKDALSEFIREIGISDRTRLLFSDPPGHGVYSECHKKEALARALNRVIEGECIYTSARFEVVVLREQTQQLLGRWMESKRNGKELGRHQQVWLNRLLLEDAYSIFLQRPIFPPPERSEPEREEDYLPTDEADGSRAHIDVHAAGKLAEGSRSAGSDPAHHLRLFANYLTPRKGILSDDTWRMVAVFTRNLTMTWLILLPVLVAVVLVGQLYYVLQPNAESSFITYPRPGQISYLPHAYEVEGPRLNETPELLQTSRARALQKQALSERIRAAAKPLLMIGGWIVVMALLWLVCTIDKEKLVEWIVVAVGMLAVAAVTVSVTSVYLPSVFDHLYDVRRWIYAWALVDLVLILYVMWRPRGEPPGADLRTKKQWRREVRASKITRLHGKLLATLVVTAFVLALSGFGHEVILFPFYFLDPGGSGTLDFIARNIGWFLLLLSAISGSIFAAHKARPSTNGTREYVEQSLKGRLVLGATPPLVVTALAVGVAWFGQWLIEEIWVIIITHFPNPQVLPRLTLAAFISVILCFIFAVFDMKWRRSCPSTGLLVMVTLLAFTLSLAVNALTAQSGDIPFADGFVVVVVAMAELLLIMRLSAVWRNANAPRPNSVAGRILLGSVGERRNLLVWIVAIVCAAVAAFFCAKYLWVLAPRPSGPGQPTWFLILPLIVVTLTGGLLLFRLSVTRDCKAPLHLAIFKEQSAAHRGRALYLLASGCLLLAVSIDCGIHVLFRHSSFNDTLPFLQLPILVAALAGSVFLLRVAAVEIGTQTSHQSSEERLVLRKLRRLMLNLKWISDWLEGKVGDTRGAVGWASAHRERLLQLVVSACILLSLGFGWLMHIPDEKAVDSFSQSSSWSIAPVLLGIWLVLLKTAVVRLKNVDEPATRKTYTRARTWALKRKSAVLWGLASASVMLAVLTGLVARAVVSDAAKEYHGASMAVTSPTFIGIVLCVTFVIFEMTWGDGENRRSLWLLTAAYVVLVALLTVSLSEQTPMAGLVQAVIGLMAAALAWIVGLGWMADPNAYSMHLFYKARLVRAYLGASNFNRLKQQKEITEAVAGDNVLLKEMRNCGRGAPYHLINTTLNLVATRDLATAQRSAASFVLSQLHCGSTRTGYRATEKYMGGRLTLGTAVAVSGAATSPNMGSRTPTAALAMLMTLLNVRLGYWAPTPKNPDWQSPRARLWPFYLLREFFSHTNDVSDYCYLTDGGHFDNTGLYSLVERGCRFIVVADCGADPEPSFSDLGNAIRRCHIDFKAEIELNITPFKKIIENRATQHFVKGKIVYSKAHAKALGWGVVESDDERTGTIILIKPSLLSDKKSDEPADVRQYAIQNSDFPQQTTTKQWFDEAQFESYRRLGEICAQSVFCDIDANGNAQAKDAARRIKRNIERYATISTNDIRELFFDTSATANQNALRPQFE